MRAKSSWCRWLSLEDCVGSLLRHGWIIGLVFLAFVCLWWHTLIFVRRDEATAFCTKAQEMRESRLAQEEFEQRKFQLAEEAKAKAERHKWTRKWFSWQP